MGVGMGMGIGHTGIVRNTEQEQGYVARTEAEGPSPCIGLARRYRPGMSRESPLVDFLKTVQYSTSAATAERTGAPSCYLRPWRG